MSVVDAFLLAKRADGLTPKTVQWHRSSLLTFSKWIEENSHHPNPETWNVTMLREYVVHLQSTTYTAATITTKVQSLLVFLRWLHAEDYTTTNLAAKIKKPVTPKTTLSTFSHAEMRKLLKACQSERDKVIVSLLYDCGLRANELCTLTLDRVVFEQGVLTVHGKGRKDRIVPFSATTAKAMRRYLNKEHSGSAYLIESRSHKCLSPNSLLQVLYRLGTRANVEDVHPHKFRHTFATEYLRNGGDPLTLQRLLGHTTLMMTNHYVTMQTSDLVQGHLTASPLTNLTKTRR
ncbi:MAG: tyrosine-type recombinase/integrase [Thermomicrobiales bacterium]